jgi:hypothetical protein
MNNETSGKIVALEFALILVSTRCHYSRTTAALDAGTSSRISL